jgi:hypothetical protein
MLQQIVYQNSGVIMKLNTPSQVVFHFQQLLEGVIMKLKKQKYVSGKELTSHLVHAVLAHSTGGIVRKALCNKVGEETHLDPGLHANHCYLQKNTI